MWLRCKPFAVWTSWWLIADVWRCERGRDWLMYFFLQVLLKRVDHYFSQNYVNCEAKYRTYPASMIKAELNYWRIWNISHPEFHWCEQIYSAVSTCGDHLPSLWHGFDKLHGLEFFPSSGLSRFLWCVQICCNFCMDVKQCQCPSSPQSCTSSVFLDREQYCDANLRW